MQGNLLADAVAKGALAPPPAPAVASSSSSARPSADGLAVGKLRVCGACGAFLSITDSEQRLMDHFEGAFAVVA